MSGSEYARRVEHEKVIERQLALGGLRLAVVLNALLGDKDEMRSHGGMPLYF